MVTVDGKIESSSGDQSTPGAASSPNPPARDSPMTGVSGVPAEHRHDKAAFHTRHWTLSFWQGILAHAIPGKY